MGFLMKRNYYASTDTCGQFCHPICLGPLALSMQGLARGGCDVRAQGHVRAGTYAHSHVHADDVSTCYDE
jgi:hypothetical protein